MRLSHILVEPLFQRGRAHDLPPGHGLVELRAMAAVSEIKLPVRDLGGGSFAPGVHFRCRTAAARRPATCS